MYVYRVINIVAIILIYMTSIPIISYLTIKFHQTRNLAIVSHADPKFLLLVHTIILLNLCIIQTIDLLTTFNFIRPFPIWTHYLLCFLYLYGSIDILFIKAYRLFVSDNKQLVRNTSVKTSNIDDSTQNINNINKFKHTFNIIRSTIFPYSINITVYILSRLTNSHSIFQSLSNIFIPCIPFLFLLSFLHSVTKFYDITKIQKQIMIQSISILIFAILYITIYK